MTPEDIKLDRYAKFRNLGQYEEFVVVGGKWREARAERAKVHHPPMQLCEWQMEAPLCLHYL